ncbi:MAG: hypothetical protein ACLPZR_18720 [Solirubrobacteraceae bacterium]
MSGELVATDQRDRTARADRFIATHITGARDGGVIDVSLTAPPSRDDRRQAVEMAALTRDISDRKQTERALAQAEERFRGAVEKPQNEMGAGLLEGLVGPAISYKQMTPLCPWLT